MSKYGTINATWKMEGADELQEAFDVLARNLTSLDKNAEQFIKRMVEQGVEYARIERLLIQATCEKEFTELAREPKVSFIPHQTMQRLLSSVPVLSETAHILATTKATHTMCLQNTKMRQVVGGGMVTTHMATLLILICSTQCNTLRV